MKCDHLIGRTLNGEVYVLASEAMEAIAELKQKLEDAKANKATCKELKAYSVVASSEAHNYINGEINLAFEAYDADEVDAAIAEIKAELDKTIAERDGNQVCIDALKQKLEDVNELIKTARQMLEDVKASHYAESVDAGMRERRLRRALYIVLARSFCCMRELAARNALYDDECKWDNFKTTCLKMAEEYK